MDLYFSTYEKRTALTSTEHIKFSILLKMVIISFMKIILILSEIISNFVCKTFVEQPITRVAAKRKVYFSE